MNQKGLHFILRAGMVLSLVALALCFISCFDLMRPMKNRWESRADTTLRAFGETESAYSNTNRKRRFGTFEDLRDTEYLASGYARDNMIEKYRVVLGTDKDKTGFAVAAIPSDLAPSSGPNYRAYIVANDTNSVELSPATELDKSMFDKLSQAEADAYLENSTYMYLEDLMQSGYLSADDWDNLASQLGCEELNLYVDLGFPAYILLAGDSSTGNDAEDQSTFKYVAVGVLFPDKEEYYMLVFRN